MSTAPARPGLNPELRIVALAKILRETEQELQTLTGGQVDAVSGKGGRPIFLQEAQDKLLQSENRYRSLAKATAQIVWTTDAKGLVLGELAEWQAFTGQSTEEVLGYGCQQAIHPDDQKRTFETWAQAVLRQKPYDLEYRLRRHDGVYRDFAVRAVPVLAWDGSVSEWVGCCTDITEQKQSQELIRENELRLDFALQAAHLGIWDVDLATDHAIRSLRHDQIFGFKTPPQEWGMEIFRRHVLPEDQGLAQQTLEEALVTGRFLLECRIVRQDKSIHWIKAEGTVRRDEGGVPIRMLGVIGDITEQKQAQQQLAVNQTLLRMASRISRLGAWQTEVPAFNVVWSDETAAIHDEVAGYSPPVATAMDYYTPVYRKIISEAFHLCAEEGVSFDVEAQIVSAKGRRIWVRAMGEAVRDKDGSIIQVQGALQDIDSMKQVEETSLQKDKLIRMAGRLTKTGGWSMETASQQAFWSDDLCDILEFPRGTAPLLEDALALYPGESRETITAAMTACAKFGTGFDLELEIDTSKGRRIWVRVCGEPERAPDGTIPRVWGAFQDLTQRKQADEKIKNQIYELERWREATLGREDRVRSLKKEVNTALEKAGECPIYIDLSPDAEQENKLRHAPEKSEQARLATLRSYDILDSPKEKDFDDLVTLAAHICDAPVAHISLVDESRQWFKASYGTETTETPRGVSFCAHTIEQTGLFVVPDASKDSRFAHNPRVTGDPRIRFYAGSPLIAPDGSELGALCVIDVKPRQLTDVQAKGLAVLGHHVMALVELRHQSRQMARSNAALLEILEDERSAKTVIRKGEEQIAEQASFLDKARDAIVVRSLAGEILFWNKGAERMFGWQREEVLGRNLDESLYTDVKKIEEIKSEVISKGEWIGELQHFTKTRAEIVVEARMTLIRDHEGNPKSILAIKTDITERKKIEAHFMRAQRMESIGTLAGGIAHDLNNILAPILMSIDLLRRQSDSPQTTKILQTIQVSAKRGADIVRQVLSFARGMEGQRIEVQPKHLLNELENIIQDTFPKDIRLQFSAPNDIWTILGDPTQVHQVLLNLSVNARDAMPNGGSLTVSVENCVLDEQYAAMHKQAKAGRYVKMKVTDSGVGIPPKLIDKIFEPFFTTKELSKGTGLGLSTVMAIVKSHGGIINVYSNQGKGTAFTVYLPAMEMSAEALKDHGALADMPRGNGETVLVVDDEASILTITGQTLEAYGYVVLIASNGADALASYLQNQEEIKVVLTDMMMPVMGGAALVHALKRINPTVKIIAASGLNAEGEIDQATSGGLKHFLIKPYTAGVLLQTMRTILDGP
jgi:two-component system cell cycle sensor histidine kinase/response regulator CckA